MKKSTIWLVWEEQAVDKPRLSGIFSSLQKAVDRVYFRMNEECNLDKTLADLYYKKRTEDNNGKLAVFYYENEPDYLHFNPDFAIIEHDLDVAFEDPNMSIFPPNGFREHFSVKES